MTQPLVTLEDYKTYKKISKTDADLELGFIIDSVNTLVRTFVGHSIIDYYTTPKVETFNIKQKQLSIQLNEWPINNVISVESRPTHQSDYVTIDPLEYHVDYITDSVYAHSSTIFDEGFGAVKVTYTAGYETVPADLKIATLDLVQHYYKEEYKERKQIGNASVDNANRYTGLASEWPVHIIRVLDMYRNV